MATLLQEYMTQNAKARPDSLMIQDGAAALTYGQMEAVSNKLARYFIATGVRRQIVSACSCLNRSHFLSRLL